MGLFVCVWRGLEGVIRDNMCCDKVLKGRWE